MRYDLSVSYGRIVWLSYYIVLIDIFIRYDTPRYAALIFISVISHGVTIHHSKYYESIVIIHWNRGQNVIFSFTMSYHCPMPKMTKSKNLSGAIAPSFIDQSLSYFTVRCRMTYSTINPDKIFWNSHSPAL